MANKKSNTVNYFQNSSSDPQVLEVVNIYNENNYDLKDSDGNILTNVSRKEFCNENTLYYVQHFTD